MNCRIFDRRLLDYINGELSLAQEEEMKIHTDECVKCRKSWEENIKIYDIMKKCSGNNLNGYRSLSGDIMNRIDDKRYNTGIHKRLLFGFRRISLFHSITAGVITVALFSGVYFAYRYNFLSYIGLSNPNSIIHGNKSSYFTTSNPGDANSTSDLTNSKEIQLSISERKQWMDYFTRVLSNSIMYGDFVVADMDDDALLNLTISYIFGNKDLNEKLQSIIEFDVYYPKASQNLTRIKRENLDSISMDLFGRQVNPQADFGDSIVYDNGYYWLYPMGNEGPVMIPRIVGCVDNLDGTITFKIEFYIDDFDMSPVHLSDGKELSRDDFYNKIMDPSVKFMESPMNKKAVRVKKATTDSSDKFIILESKEY
jgi:hypothetical protein